MIGFASIGFAAVVVIVVVVIVVKLNCKTKDGSSISQ